MGVVGIRKSKNQTKPQKVVPKIETKVEKKITKIIKRKFRLITTKRKENLRKTTLKFFYKYFFVEFSRNRNMSGWKI
jgi:hypothetical protein